MKCLTVLRSKQAFVSLVVSIVLACAGPDKAGRMSAIQEALNKDYGVLKFALGDNLRLAPESLEMYRQAERNGLLTIQEVPQGYWDNFLNQTQSLAAPYNIAPTEKLTGVGSEAPGENGIRFLQVTVANAALGKINKDEEYTGALATPGEKHRVVLGTFRRVSTPAAWVVGAALSAPPGIELTGNRAADNAHLAAMADHGSFRFRCVVRWNEPSKRWSVVALDRGIDDRWESSSVK